MNVFQESYGFDNIGIAGIYERSYLIFGNTKCQMAVFLEYLSVINGIIYVRGFQIILICDNYTIRMVVNVRILGDILVNRFEFQDCSGFLP